MLTPENAIFIGFWLENCCLVEVISLGGGKMSKFLAGEGTPQYGKPCDVLFLGLHDPP